MKFKILLLLLFVSTFAKAQLNPAISINKNFFNVSIYCDDSITVPLTVYNYGTANLNIDARNSTHISVYPNFDTIPPGDSTILQVKIDSKGLLFGISNDILYIHSNDPWTPLLNIMANITVVPTIYKINLSDTLIDFGSTQEFTSDTLIFEIQNAGCISLYVSSFSQLQNSAFRIINYPPPYYVTKYIGRKIHVVFTPNSANLFTDTLHIFNADVDTFVVFKGLGTGSPIISTSADSLFANIQNCGDSTFLPLTIYNTGLGDLNFEIIQSNISSISGTIPINDSNVVQIPVYTNDKVSGNYIEYLQLNSDDPINPQNTIVLTYDLMGNPQMILPRTNISFGTRTKYSQNIDSLEIQNPGCDTLIFQNIFTNSPFFIVPTNSLKIPPFQTKKLPIRFHSTILGNYSDTLYLINNVKDTVIYLSGTIITSTIELSMDTVNVNMFACDDSLTIPLKIYNNGNSSVNFSVLGDKFQSHYQDKKEYWLPNDLSFSNLNPLTDTIIISASVDNGIYATSASVYVDGNLEQNISPTTFISGQWWIICPSAYFKLSGHKVKTYLADGNLDIGVGLQGTQTNPHRPPPKTRVWVQTKGKDWIIAKPKSGNIANSDSTIVNITFYPQRYPAGKYQTNIKIHTNDSIDPIICIPTVLNIDSNICVDYKYKFNSSCSGSVEFTDNTINEPHTWYWDFGNGDSSNLQNPIYHFDSIGNYNVKLITCNNSNCDSITKIISILDVSGPKSIDNINYISYRPTYWASYFGISRVILDSLDNSSTLMFSKESGYQDFSCLPATHLNTGEIYTLKLETGEIDWGKESFAWIDYNDNGFFEDSTEQLTFNYNPFTPDDSTQFVVPFHAVKNKAIKMRVASGDFQVEKYRISNGQIEDYTIIINPDNRPPVANFADSLLDNCSGLIQFTDSSTRLPNRWHWDFGNGDTSNNQHPAYAFGAAGNYNVQLISCNPGGSCDTIQKNVTVPNITGPKLACRPQTSNYCCGYGIYNVQLDSLNHASGDAANGYEDFACDQTINLRTGETYVLNLQSDSINFVNSKAWIDYNNNAVFEPSEQIFESLNQQTFLSDTFAIPFFVTTNSPLRMRIGLDDTSQNISPCGNAVKGQFEDYTVNIIYDNAPTQADFQHAIIDSCLGIIGFQDQSTRIPNTWHWDFGDGDTSILQHPNHAYANKGVYLVKLIACNMFGCDTIQKNIQFSCKIGPAIPPRGNQNFQSNFSNNEIMDDDSRNSKFTLFQEKKQLQKEIHFNVFPNPNKGIFTINYVGFENDLQLEIINPLGQIVHNQLLTSPDEGSIQLDLANQAKGIYLIKLISDGKIYTKRVIILDN